MKRMLSICLITTLILISLACSNPSPTTSALPATIQVNFQYGSPTVAYHNVYAIWMENSSESYWQPVRICKKLTAGGLTGIALPYWKLNKYPHMQSDCDAISSATVINQDFTVSAAMTDPAVTSIDVYMEIDHSYDANGWFDDQPALLYKATIDLSNKSATTYTMTVCGWTPNAATENVIAGTPSGVSQTEMRYITNAKNGTAFGAADPDASATKMVKQVTVTVIR